MTQKFVFDVDLDKE